MKLIPLSEIQIPERRQRREFPLAKMQALTNSILEHGLMVPVILRIEADAYVLVAGERRIRALRDIYDLQQRIHYDGELLDHGLVPYVSVGELDRLEREVVELEENIQREALTWVERAAATARIEAIRREQAQHAGTAPPTVADIADEVRGATEGRGYADTRREILIARHLDDPEVAAAKSLDEGWKILQRKQLSNDHAAKAAEVGRTFTSALHRAYCADALSWLAECPAKQFDVILTDPPYGIGADKFGDSGGKTTGGHNYADDPDSFRRIIDAAEKHLFRIAKPQAHLYWFLDIETFWRAREAFERAGWYVWRTPFIWVKPGAYRAPRPEHGPQRQYEMLLYAIKGDRKVTRLYSDVLTYSPDSNLDHMAQKPVALYTDLLKRSALPGDSVLDPFMGSGTIFPAAHALKCKATGIEIDETSYGTALRRLEGLK